MNNADLVWIRSRLMSDGRNNLVKGKLPKFKKNSTWGYYPMYIGDVKSMSGSNIIVNSWKHDGVYFEIIDHPPLSELLYQAEAEKSLIVRTYEAMYFLESRKKLLKFLEDAIVKTPGGSEEYKKVNSLQDKIAANNPKLGISFK